MVELSGFPSRNFRVEEPKQVSLVMWFIMYPLVVHLLLMLLLKTNFLSGSGICFSKVMLESHNMVWHRNIHCGSVIHNVNFKSCLPTKH